jgi:hypothetical protein
VVRPFSLLIVYEMTFIHVIQTSAFVWIDDASDASDADADADADVIGER